MVKQLLCLVLVYIAFLQPVRAACSVETGRFAADTVDAVTTVSSTFQGKVLIVCATRQTADGTDNTSNASWSCGVSDCTNLRAIGWAGDDNVGDTNVGREWSTTESLQLFSDGTPTVLRSITGVSCGASSFDLTWDGTPAAAYLGGYMLLGGTDISNVKVGTGTLPTLTGNHDNTDPGFEPDFVLLLHANSTAAGTSVHTGGGLGFAATSAKEFSLAWNTQDAQSMATAFNAHTYVNSAATMAGLADGAGTLNFLADYVGTITNGFRLNVSDAPPAAWQYGYLAVKGCQWDVGVLDLGATPKSVTGMAFAPKALWGVTGTATADATVTVNLEVSVGGAASTSTEVVFSALHSDTADPTAVSMFNGVTLVNNSSFGTTPDWSLDSLNSDGFTLSTAGTPAGIEFGWFAMSDNAAPPSVTGVGWYGPYGYFKLDSTQKGWSSCGFLEC